MVHFLSLSSGSNGNCYYIGNGDRGILIDVGIGGRTVKKRLLQNGIGIENDPRPYVAFIRKFAVEKKVAVADAAKRYGRLWRQGIPYNTLMTNTINHPDKDGMKIFADALISIFGE